MQDRCCFVKTLLLLFLFLAPCRPGITAVSVAAEHLQAQSPQQKLDQLFEDFFHEYVELFPIFAILIGDHRYDDKLQIEISEEHRQRQRTLYSAYLRKLSEIDRNSLQDRDRLNYDIFKYDLDLRLEGLQFNEHLIPDLKPDSLFRAIAPGEVTGIPDWFRTVYYYNNYLKRLQRIPARIDTAVANMRKGLTHGVLASRYALEEELRQIDRMLAVSVQWSLFYKPILVMPAVIDDVDKARIKRETSQVIQQVIIPAYKRLIAFVRQEYLPLTTASTGMSMVPGGRARYVYLLKAMTTTTLTPDEIFQIDIEEVKRLKKEIQEMQEKMGFKRSFGAFAMHLQQNTPKYSKQNLIRAYEALGTNVTAQLPRFFTRLPASSYEIRPVEGLSGRGLAGAYGDSGAGGAHQGIVYIDRSQVRVALNASVFLHEAVPGHHLQRSLQRSAFDLPAFRRYGSYTAFVEGWATYAESLGQDLGVYSDPYQRLVYLQSQISKSLRVVLDVGRYYEGWDLLRAQRFAEREVGRIVPGVPLVIEPAGRTMAYKVGQFKISAIRSKAQKALGSKFDIRAFHDELLKDGAMPLDVLEAKMDQWIQSQLH
jgi:uncharacterized protein (DUF885 family)